MSGISPGWFRVAAPPRVFFKVMLTATRKFGRQLAATRKFGRQVAATRKFKLSMRHIQFNSIPHSSFFPNEFRSHFWPSCKDCNRVCLYQGVIVYTRPFRSRGKYTDLYVNNRRDQWGSEVPFATHSDRCAIPHVQLSVWLGAQSRATIGRDIVHVPIIHDGITWEYKHDMFLGKVRACVSTVCQSVYKNVRACGCLCVCM